jgi:alkylation response protein AidB-like acyl-CoA dehydrogenase
MDFALSAEQQMFRALFEDFAAKEVAKTAEQADKQEVLPPKLLQRAAAQGFLGALVPEEPHGGAGLDTVSYTLLLEALAAECMSIALTVHVHNSLALRTILKHAHAALTESVLPEMVMGDRVGAFALTEPNAGSSPAHMRTTAARRGDGWVLNGSKTWVSNGGMAGVYVVFAVTDATAGTQGISAFAVPAESRGLVVGGREKTLGLRGASMTRLYLENCFVSPEHLLGRKGEGYRIALEAIDFGRIAVAAIGLGAGRRAIDLACRFASERVQFGGPIAQKQAIQAYLADAATSLAAAECLVRRAAWLVDEQKPFTREAAMAKLFTSRMAADVTDQALQIHGGYGFMTDYPIERYYRDARALELVEGTSQVQQIVIASDLLAPYGIKVRP